MLFACGLSRRFKSFPIPTSCSCFRSNETWYVCASPTNAGLSGAEPSDEESELSADEEGDEAPDEEAGGEWDSVFSEPFSLDDIENDPTAEAARAARARDAMYKHQWVTDTHELSRNVDAIVESMYRLRRFTACMCAAEILDVYTKQRNSHRKNARPPKRLRA